MPIDHASIVGVGAVTAYGWGIDALWSGLESGESAATLHLNLGDRFPEPCWFARVPEDTRAPEKDARNTGSTRYQQAFAFAVDEALADARKSGWAPGLRVAIVHATTRGDLELFRTRYLAWDTLRPRRAYVEQAWTKPSGDVMVRHGFNGPAMVVSAACASGLHAVAVAQRLLTCGDATDVIVVGADVGFDGEEMRLFNSLGPLIFDTPPRDACRPFQTNSRGFVLGEGIAAMVLTSKPVPSRYVRVLASVMGNDAYHPVSINPDHREMLRIVDDALELAKIGKPDVRYFAAHASGSSLCYEADATVLTHLGPQVTAFGLKPLMGHCMGAAALLDTVAVAKAYREGHLPVPQLAVGADAHPQLARNPLRYGPGLTLQMGLGFGGNISVIVFGPDGDGAQTP
jgi:3-oxoacyl-[acyl-carrier-protein] synthase II